MDRRQKAKRKTEPNEITGVQIMNNWQLQRVDTIDWIKDTSGIYCLIDWDVKTDTVRLDIMTDEHEPIISFAGASDNVRKAVGRWIDNSRLLQTTRKRISAEHAAYIGSELEKADTMRIDYVQDGQKTSAALTAMRKSDSELVQKFFADNKEKADEIADEFASDNFSSTDKADEDNLDAYRKYIEYNLDRIERCEFTPICFAEFIDSEEIEIYSKLPG